MAYITTRGLSRKNSSSFWFFPQTAAFKTGEQFADADDAETDFIDPPGGINHIGVSMQCMGKDIGIIFWIGFDLSGSSHLIYVPFFTKMPFTFRNEMGYDSSQGEA